MLTSEAFDTKIPDIVSELTYAASTVESTNPDLIELLSRAVDLIRYLRKENAKLEVHYTNYMWDKYPDRMGQ